MFYRLLVYRPISYKYLLVKVYYFFNFLVFWLDYYSVKNSYSNFNQLKAILVDHDRYDLSPAVLILGRKFNVATYGFIHGSTLPPYSYYPLLSEKLFCWGEYHYNQFRLLGVPANNLIISGNQMICGQDEERTGIAAESFVKPRKSLLILGGGAKEENILLLKAYSTIVKGFGMEGNVKLHPRNVIADYINEIELYSFNIWDKKLVRSTLDGKGFIFFNHSSALGVELSAQGELVCYLDVLERHIGLGKLYMNQFPQLGFSSLRIQRIELQGVTELNEKVFANILNSSRHFYQLCKEIHHFSRTLVKAKGNQAISLIRKELEGSNE